MIQKIKEIHSFYTHQDHITHKIQLLKTVLTYFQIFYLTVVSEDLFLLMDILRIHSEILMFFSDILISIQAILIIIFFYS